MVTKELKQYKIIFPKYWWVEDRSKEKYKSTREENLLFHVSQNDYFGTLATVLQLVQEDLPEVTQKSKYHKMILKNSTKDLMFLQKNYKISPKNFKE
ncbi:MAG: hypothetical protein K9L98_01980 [Candidatus Pacebacteria bacterium]|nr:hypothetical protein [Candidatus Paceibacterota bacterium]